MQRRGRAFWSRLVAEFERSGLKHEAFAATQGVPVGTLRKWIYRLRRERGPAPRLLPVRVAAPGPAAPPRPGAGPAGPVEAMLPDGVHLRFAPGTDSRYVADVLWQLRRASC